jgi:hypothetical protein
MHGSPLLPSLADALSAVAESHRALGTFVPTTLSSISVDALRAARQAISAGVVSPLVALPPPDLLLPAAASSAGGEEARVESERGDILSLQESPEVLQLPLELQVRPAGSFWTGKRKSEGWGRPC